MAVRVRLDETRPFGNHLPEFRPADPTRVTDAEREMARVVFRILSTPIDRQRTPLDTAIEILGRYEENRDALLGAVERSVRRGIKEGDARTRRDLNEHLRRLGSPVRLVAPNTTRNRKPKGTSDEVLKAAEVVEVAWSSIEPAAFQAPVIEGAQELSQEFTTRILSDLSASASSAVRFEISDILASRPAPTETVRDLQNRIQGILADASTDTMSGLTLRQQRANTNEALSAMEAALKNGATDAQAQARFDQVLEKGAERRRRQRARTIARTETNRAVNAATRQSFDTAIAEGLIEPDSQAQWVTGPFDVCPICVSLAGQTVSLIEQGQFETDLTSSPTLYPPAHPNCRCKIRLVPATGAPKLVGANTPDDPLRYEFPAGFEEDVTGLPPRPDTPKVTADRYRSAGATDVERARRIYRDLGYDAPPRVVDDLAEHIDAAPTGQLSRAVTEVYDGATSTLRSAEEIAEEFRTGGMFWGEGLSGSGVYTIEGSEAVLQEYLAGRLSNLGRAVESGNATILRMTATPDAKVLTATRRELADLVERTGIEDEMVAAASEGFDIVRVVKGDNVEVVVLNRGAVIVERTGQDAAQRLGQFQATARSDDLFSAAVEKRDATGQSDWLSKVAPAKVEDAKRTGLYDEIARDGVLEPVDVFVRPASALKDDGPRFELATGHHRVAVAHDLGIDVPVRFYGKGFAEETGHMASRRPDGSFGLHGPR